MSQNEEHDVPKHDVPNEAQVKLNFRVRSPKDDLTLLVDGEKLYVPKIVLMLASPVFDSEFREKSQDEVEMPDKKYEDVLMFLECIHPGFLTHVTMTNVFAVLPIANEYSVQHLQKQCEAVLLSNTNSSTTVETICNYLSLAHKFELRDLEEKCRQLAGEKSNCSYRTQFREGSEKYNVPVETQAKVFREMCETLSKNIKREMDNNTDINSMKRTINTHL